MVDILTEKIDESVDKYRELRNKNPIGIDDHVIMPDKRFIRGMIYARGMELMSLQITQE